MNPMPKSMLPLKIILRVLGDRLSMGIASSNRSFIWEIKIRHPVDRDLDFRSCDSRYKGNVQSIHERE